MAKFPSLTFTEKGTQMLVLAQNSHTLTFVCGKLGSGTLFDSDNISQFSDLKSPKMTLPITKVDDGNAEKIILTFDTSNTTLEEGFVSRELGIFARLDNGPEVLYAYSNAGSNYDYIPSKDTPSDENRLVVNLVVSSSANVAVTIDETIVYAHMSDVTEKIDEHNSDDGAHEKKFGLFQKISTLGDSIIQQLAITAAITVITALSTNSRFGQLLKMVLDASGVRYLMGQNGYICFGSFFGGGIIQWGRNRSNETFLYPISLLEKVYYASSIHIGKSPEPNHIVSIDSISSLTSIVFVTSSSSDFDQFILILGR